MPETPHCWAKLAKAGRNQAERVARMVRKMHWPSNMNISVQGQRVFRPDPRACALCRRPSAEGRAALAAAPELGRQGGVVVEGHVDV